jgi:hypothetical protein
MKQITKILIIFFISVLFCFPSKIIFSKVDFPDSRKLQPAPTNITPNISGNINYNFDKEETKTNFFQDLFFPQDKEKNIDIENDIFPGKNNKTGYFLKIVIFFTIAFIFLMIFIFVRKRNK